MVTNFSPRNLNVSKLMRDNWNIIQNTEELNQIFPEKPIMGFRRLTNLRDKLTSAKIRYPPWKNLWHLGGGGGHGDRVVTLSPPTSEAGVRFPAWPQVGKLVVACRWSAVYSTEP